MGRTKEAWMLMNEYNSLKESLAMDEDEYFQTYRVIEDKLKLLSEELGKYDLQVQPDIDLRRSDN